mmetsp:Transcript_5378/g.16241  ORF Transcript_5378/g.16241 Transcript_5378/m.16241 type:complete len:261 (+) Transcript_5378:2644-3426(+)
MDGEEHQLAAARKLPGLPARLPRSRARGERDVGRREDPGQLGLGAARRVWDLHHSHHSGFSQAAQLEDSVHIAAADHDVRRLLRLHPAPYLPQRVGHEESGDRWIDARDPPHGLDPSEPGNAWGLLHAGVRGHRFAWPAPGVRGQLRRGAQAGGGPEVLLLDGAGGLRAWAPVYLRRACPGHRGAARSTGAFVSRPNDSGPDPGRQPRQGAPWGHVLLQLGLLGRRPGRRLGSRGRRGRQGAPPGRLMQEEREEKQIVKL